VGKIWKGEKMAKKQEFFHCDGFYFDRVCPSRGEQDVADIRHDQAGWLRQCRCFCKTRGLSPFNDWDLCPHCVEHKSYFRAEPRVLTGRVIPVTPFQVKEEGTARTIKAYKTAKSVRFFLKKAEKPEEVYGVEVNSGKLIGVKR